MAYKNSSEVKKELNKPECEHGFKVSDETNVVAFVRMRRYHHETKTLFGPVIPELKALDSVIRFDECVSEKNFGEKGIGNVRIGKNLYSGEFFVWTKKLLGMFSIMAEHVYYSSGGDYPCVITGGNEEYGVVVAPRIEGV